jgi:hypothetical protein
LYVVDGGEVVVLDLTQLQEAREEDCLSIYMFIISISENAGV